MFHFSQTKIFIAITCMQETFPTDLFASFFTQISFPICFFKLSTACELFIEYFTSTTYNSSLGVTSEGREVHFTTPVHALWKWNQHKMPADKNAFVQLCYISVKKASMGVL